MEDGSQVWDQVRSCDQNSAGRSTQAPGFLRDGACTGFSLCSRVGNFINPDRSSPGLGVSQHFFERWHLSFRCDSVLPRSLISARRPRVPPPVAKYQPTLARHGPGTQMPSVRRWTFPGIERTEPVPFFSDNGQGGWPSCQGRMPTCYCVRGPPFIEVFQSAEHIDALAPWLTTRAEASGRAVNASTLDSHDTSCKSKYFAKAAARPLPQT